MSATDSRASLERGMENHRDCCGWRPEGERCGAVSPGKGESICTRDPGHDGSHYDAARCVQWERESDWREAKKAGGAE